MIDFNRRKKAFALLFFSLLVLSACHSIPDQNYHRICTPTDNEQNCIPKEKFVKRNGECGRPGMAADANGCTPMGVAAEGWISGKKNEMGCENAREWEQENYEIATLEYQTEEGKEVKKFQQQQLDAILDNIENSNKPIYLVIFIHGWHHNAMDTDRNLTLFNNLLARRRYELDQMNKKHKVLGVYIGWQGENINGFLSNFTIGSRARAANRLGESKEFSDDLKKLEDAINAKNEDSRMLIVGHSLGGRVASRYMLKHISDPENPTWAPLGEHALVVTINPAIGSDAFDNVMKNRAKESDKLPSWINITSRDDTATGLIFSFSSYLNFYLSFAEGITDGYLGGSHHYAIGHYNKYITHNIKITSEDNNTKSGGKYGPLSAQYRKTDWYKINSCADTKTSYAHYFIEGNTSNLYEIKFSKNKNNVSDNEFPIRFLNISTDKDVIGSESEDDIKSNHNFYIQTIADRLLDELVFDK